jgi:DNA-directed RNA polymerase subunit F
MKDAQTILEKVQQFFVELVKEDQSFAVAPEMAPVSGTPEMAVKMMDAKLADGTMVQVTELAVGGVVTIEGMPAPVGEHKLEDGTIIVLGDNGAIMEIKPATTEEVAPIMEDMSAKFAAFENATNEKFAAYEEKFAAYETKLTQANKVIEGLMQISKMLVEAPQGTPDASVKTSNAFADQKLDAKAEFENFSKSICS